MDLSKEELNDLSTLERYQKQKWFIDSFCLKTGHSFGELALLNGSPRVATIKCLSPVYLASLEQEDFQKILKRKEQKSQLKK